MFTRQCPNSQLIHEHLLSRLGVYIPVNNLSSRKICLSCYKFHSHIVNLETINKPSSSDEELELLIKGLNEKKNMTVKIIVDDALLAVTTFVGTSLLQQRALLLPQVSRFFLEKYGFSRSVMIYII